MNKQLTEERMDEIQLLFDQFPKTYLESVEDLWEAHKELLKRYAAVQLDHSNW